MQLKLIILILLLFTSNNVGAASRVPDSATHSAKIIDLDTDEIIYELQPEKLMLPASNQKIVTLYAAMKILKKDVDFSTEAFVKPHFQKKGLKDLYLKFKANPFLTKEAVESLILQVKSKGVSKVEHVIIDDSEFDDESFPPDWQVGNLKFAFSAPISPIIVDQNYFKVGLQLDAHKKLILKGTPHFIKLTNKAEYNKKEEDCELELKALPNNEYVLHGCYTKKDLPPVLQIAIQNPRLYIKNLLEKLFNSRGVKYKTINFGKEPELAKSLAVIPSPKLFDVLKKMMVESDNLIAELLVKKIAKQVSNKEGTWNIGVKAITDILKKDINFKDSDFLVKDGSGGSRKNLISPNAIIKILSSAYKDAAISNEFISTFPQAGQVGSTLEQRFIGLAPQVKVYAKTGTIDNVSTLAGYVFFDNGKKYAFSIMTNNAICEKYSSLKNWEEQVLTTALNLPFN